MAKYFKIGIYLFAYCAYKLKIDNKPPKDVDENLTMMIF